MAVEIRMPQLSDTMEKGKIVTWNVDEGDEIERGEVIAEIETDKATMDLEAFDSGTLLKKLYTEGQEAPTQSLIAVIGEDGEDISDLLQDAEDEASAESETPDSEPADEEISADNEPAQTTIEKETEQTQAEPDKHEQPEDPEDPEPQYEKPEPPETEQSSTPKISKSSEGDGRLRVSPVARRLASENSIDLHSLDGSGPEGRIVKRDVQRAIEEGTHRITRGGGSAGEPKASPLESKQEELSGMRKTIANRMTEAHRDVPHFYLESEIDMERVDEVREELTTLAAGDLEYSYNDFIMAASARALCEEPRVNASYHEDYIQFYDRVDLAFAVAVENGLFTPVIHKAETLTIKQIHERSKELAKKARSGNITPDEYKGGTFTVSNLGMFEVTNFSAVINPPQAAILATGTVQEKPVAENGDLAVRKRMEVTLSCDHRTIDGAIGARFLGEFKQIMEHPTLLLT